MVSEKAQSTLMFTFQSKELDEKDYMLLKSSHYLNRRDDRPSSHSKIGLVKHMSLWSGHGGSSGAPATTSFDPCLLCLEGLFFYYSSIPNRLLRMLSSLFWNLTTTNIRNFMPRILDFLKRLFQNISFLDILRVWK